MAVVVRSRSIQEIIWEGEDIRRRVARRRCLANFDALLTQLEECNLRHGGWVPETLRTAVLRAGVPCSPGMNAPDLIEAIFEIQERFMLQQVSPLPVIDQIRRIAV